MRNLRIQQIGENWILIDADTGALVTGAVRDGDGLRFNEGSAVRKGRDLLAFIEGYEATYGPDGEVDPGLTHEVRNRSARRMRNATGASPRGRPSRHPRPWWR